MTVTTYDPAGGRRHLETTANLVVVHDVMAEAMNNLQGVYMRAAIRAEEGSTERAWWSAQDRAVREFRATIDPRDRQAMLAALDRAKAEIAHARAATGEA